MKITIKDDFDLYKTAHSGQCFRVSQNNDTYRFITKENYVDIKRTGDTSYEVSASKSEWDSIWAHYFDLETSYTDIRNMIPESDTYIFGASKIGKGIRILNQDRFEMLISFIISQRKSIPAISSCVEKLSRSYGKRILTHTGEELYAFPSPSSLARATEEELKEKGLGYRVSYVLSAAQKVASGELDLEKAAELNDEELFGTLKSLYGVGDKVANCVLLFGYHRTGRAPVDTWIKKVIDEEYNGVDPFDKYGDVAGIMQQYVFYNAQHAKEVI